MNDYRWFIKSLVQRGWSFTPWGEKQDNHYSSEAKRVLRQIERTSLDFQYFIQSFLAIGKTLGFYLTLIIL